MLTGLWLYLTPLLIIIFFSSSEAFFLTDREESNSFLKSSSSRRIRRDNRAGVYEELQPPNFERECIEENCTDEEANECNTDKSILKRHLQENVQNFKKFKSTPCEYRRGPKRKAEASR